MESAPQRPFVLRVVDAETGADLRDVAVHRAITKWHPHGPTIEPPVAATRIAAGNSPLALPIAPQRGMRMAQPLVVIAAGRGLREFAAELGGDGTATIALEPGGALEVLATDLPAGAVADVRLHRMDDVIAELERRAARESERESREPRRDAADRPRFERSFREQLATVKRGPDPSLPLDPLFAHDLLALRAERVAAAAPGAPYRFEQLRCGVWAVSVVQQIGEAGYCMGLAFATVTAGACARVVVPWQRKDAPRLLRLAGEVTIDRGWEQIPGAAPLELDLRCEKVDPAEGSDHFYGKERTLALRDLPVEPGAPWRFAFDAGPCPPGYYELELPRFCIAFEEIVESAAPLRLIVPPPVAVELTLLPPTGDRVLSCRKVTHIGGELQRPFRATWGHAEPDLEDGRFRFFAPRGLLRVGISELEQRMSASGGRWMIDGDRAALTLRVEPTPIELTVEARDGEARVPHPFDGELKIWRDGRRVAFNFSFPAMGCEITAQLPGPGRYRIALCGLMGYRDSEPIDVDVAGPLPLRVVVPLRRSEA